MGTGEPADVKPGAAFPGKERSGPRRLLDVAPVWTTSNSSSPFTCKALGDREVQSCSTRGSVLVVWKGSVCFMSSRSCLASEYVTKKIQLRETESRENGTEMPPFSFPPLQHHSLEPCCPYSQPQNSHQPTDLWVPATACAQELIPGS